MSWSQTQQSEDLYDQITILVGSAIRLLSGDAGVFVVSNEAFDPQSNTEYTLYRLTESALMPLLSYIRESKRPNSHCPLVIDTLSPTLVKQLAICDEDEELLRDVKGTKEQPVLERCSLLVNDHAGFLGMLHYLRPPGSSSCFERSDESEGALRLFIAHFAAGLRSALKWQSLVKEQRRLAAIFQQSAEGILTVDTALRIIDFNPTMERLTGWRENEVLGRFYYEVLHPKDRLGNELGLQDSLILQAFAGGEPTSGILTVRDITRERQQEEQRSTFISVISHELQTPIAIIKGYASTLARTDATFDRESLRSRLQAVEEEADRLNKLVGNLLYASRIQAGGLQMELATLDLSNLVQKVTHRLQVKSPGVTVKVNLPPNLPTVMADRDRIEEVLENLLDNAVKYSPDKPVVTVVCRTTGDEVIVSVSDAGMGISLREQEQIFDRFYRVGNAMTNSLQGAGLGLYICRAIVEAHGGRIWVESALHQGSTFLFSLPRMEKAHLPMVVF